MYNCIFILFLIIPSGSPLSARGTPVTSLQQRSLEGTDVHGSGLLRRTLARNYKEMREELFRKVGGVKGKMGGVKWKEIKS